MSTTAFLAQSNRVVVIAGVSFALFWILGYGLSMVTLLSIMNTTASFFIVLQSVASRRTGIGMESRTSFVEAFSTLRDSKKHCLQKG
jgi:hypothetical protein